MTSAPLALDLLSDIGAQYARHSLDGSTQILVIGFAGTYRHGSQGNPDARRMAAHVAAGLAAWDADGVVLDLSALAYRWGDGLIGVFEIIDQGARLPRPSAVVSGPGSQAGLSSLCAAASLFTDVDAAVTAVHAEVVERDAEERRDEDVLTLAVLVRDDLSVADAIELAARAPVAYQEHHPGDWRTLSWRLDHARVAVFRAGVEELTWALTCAPAHALRRSDGIAAVVLGARAELPPRVLALPRW